MYECRCDEGLKPKGEESTCFTYTGLLGELQHLNLETRLESESWRWTSVFFSFFFEFWSCGSWTKKTTNGTILATERQQGWQGGRMCRRARCPRHTVSGRGVRREAQRTTDGRWRRKRGASRTLLTLQTRLGAQLGEILTQAASAQATAISTQSARAQYGLLGTGRGDCSRKRLSHTDPTRPSTKGRLLIFSDRHLTIGVPKRRHVRVRWAISRL